MNKEKQYLKIESASKKNDMVIVNWSLCRRIWLEGIRQEQILEHGQSILKFRCDGSRWDDRTMIRGSWFYQELTGRYLLKHYDF